MEGRNSEAVRKLRKNIQIFEGKKAQEQKKLCEKAKRIYEPNGLIKEIPPTWSCSRDETMQAVLDKLSKEKNNIKFYRLMLIYKYIFICCRKSDKHYFLYLN